MKVYLVFRLELIPHQAGLNTPLCPLQPCQTTQGKTLPSSVEWDQTNTLPVAAEDCSGGASTSMVTCVFKGCTHTPMVSMSLASRDTTNIHWHEATSQMQMLALPRPARLCIPLFFLPQLFLCAPHPCLLLNCCPGNVLGYGLVQRCVHFLWIFIKG